MLPAVIWVAPVRGLLPLTSSTVTARVRGWMLPSPSWPFTLLPKQRTWPPATMRAGVVGARGDGGDADQRTAGPVLDHVRPAVLLVAGAELAVLVLAPAAGLSGREPGARVVGTEGQLGDLGELADVADALHEPGAVGVRDAVEPETVGVTRAPAHGPPGAQAGTSVGVAVLHLHHLRDGAAALRRGIGPCGRTGQYEQGGEGGREQEQAAGHRRGLRRVGAMATRP